MPLATTAPRPASTHPRPGGRVGAPVLASRCGPDAVDGSSVVLICGSSGCGHGCVPYLHPRRRTTSSTTDSRRCTSGVRGPAGSARGHSGVVQHRGGLGGGEPAPGVEGVVVPVGTEVRPGVVGGGGDG